MNSSHFGFSVRMQGSLEKTIMLIKIKKKTATEEDKT